MKAQIVLAETQRPDNPDQALESLSIARNIAETLGVHSSVDIYLRIAALHIESGHPGKAKPFWDKAKGVLENYSDPAKHYQFWYASSRLAKVQGDYDQAESCLRTALQPLEKMRSSIGVDTYKINFFGDKTTSYHELVELLLKKGEFIEAFRFLKRTKGRTLLDMISQADVSRHRKGDPLFTALNKSERQLSNTLARYEKVAGLVTGTQEAQSATNDQLERVCRQYRGLQLKLKERNQSFSSLMTGESLEPNELVRSLDGSVAVLEYFSSGNNLGVFVITSEGIRYVKLKGSERELEPLVKFFRRALYLLDCFSHLESCHDSCHRTRSLVLIPYLLIGVIPSIRSLK